MAVAGLGGGVAPGSREGSDREVSLTCASPTAGGLEMGLRVMLWMLRASLLLAMAMGGWLCCDTSRWPRKVRAEFAQRVPSTGPSIGPLANTDPSGPVCTGSDTSSPHPSFPGTAGGWGEPRARFAPCSLVLTRRW